MDVIRWYLCPLELDVEGLRRRPVPFSWLGGGRRSSFNLDNDWCLLRRRCDEVGHVELTTTLSQDRKSAEGDVRVRAGASPILALPLAATVADLSNEARFRISQYTSIRLGESVSDVIDRLGVLSQSNFDRRKEVMDSERDVVEE